MNLFLKQAYLERIGIKEIEIPSLQYLKKLQYQHLLSIPFEDLDIPAKRIEPDISKFYEKIITNKRGGFCYELNGLFDWLLSSLGFKVDMLSAKVFNSSKNEYGPEYDHMALLVHLDGTDYLVDVGFGESFRIPIELPAGEVKDVSGHYRILNINNNIFELMKENEEGWEIQYRFTTETKLLDDFKEMCSFQQDSPDSHFRTRMLCTIATKNGRITLSNNSLTITENGKKNKINFESTDNFNIYLKKYFNITLE